MAGTVVPRDPGAVQHERDTRAVQGAVHEDLIEGAVDECRIERDNGVEAPEGEPGRAGSRMLFCNTHVVRACGEPSSKRLEPGGAEHRRRDGDDVGTLLPDTDECLGEHGGPGRARHGERFPGIRVDDPDSVESVGLIVLGRSVPMTLVGDDMNDHGSAEVSGARQREFNFGFIVSVDGSDVLETEVLEHSLRRQDILRTLLHSMQGPIQLGSDERCALDCRLPPLQ